MSLFRKNDENTSDVPFSLALVIPVEAQDETNLELELAQMDLISMCSMALTISSDSPGSVGEETLSACDRNMLEIRDYCANRSDLITCADERIQQYISARGINP
jgi:hypothetical protein